MDVKKTIKARPASEVQESFMNRFRQALPPGIGMAEELAELLGISTDSAYRRIRGETGLTIDEIYTITRKYPISIDETFSNRGDTVTFGYTKLTNSAANFEAYLSRLTGHVKTIAKFENRKIYYVAEEIPLFYSFYSPLFTDFKLFYWQRSVLNCPEYQQPRYEKGIIPQRLVDIANEGFRTYMTIPSVEVWTDLTVLTGLRQVGFYFDTGVLSKETALELLHEYRKTIEMVQQNAESAHKLPGDSQETYQLYSSDVVLGTNCIYTIMGDARYSYISFNTLNSLTTSNPEFCNETEHWMRNLEKKSTLISGIGSKHRYQFFSSMYMKIDEQIARTSGS
jgi:hypothetical protein